MIYADLLSLLKSQAEPSLSAFHAKLIKTPKEEVLGVRTATLRKIAKSIDIEEAVYYPDDFYEVKFIKLTVISCLPYERFIEYLPYALPLIENWALCDGFKAKCIQKHRKEFLSKLEEIHQTGREFFVRYALVCLLNDYVTEEYLPVVFAYLRKTDCAEYYVHMAAAWLTAEVLVKHYDVGVAFLKEYSLDAKTHNKSIQKAVESYRLTNEQKEFLKTLKIKK